MQAQRNAPVSGHVRRYDGKRGATWYAKYRLPDGRQVQKRLGPVWTGKGRPPDGYFTERTAKAALDATLTDARRGTLPGLVRTGATFNDAAEEWYHHGIDEGGPRGPWKPSTRRDYRSVLDVHLVPAFGDCRLEDLTARKIEAWRRDRMQAKKLPRRTAIKVVAVMHGICERARRTYGLRENPVAGVERIRDLYDPARFDPYTPEEIMTLVRAAASEQDGAIYLTAA
jgi:integrase